MSFVPSAETIKTFSLKTVGVFDTPQEFYQTLFYDYAAYSKYMELGEKFCAERADRSSKGLPYRCLAKPELNYSGKFTFEIFGYAYPACDVVWYLDGDIPEEYITIEMYVKAVLINVEAWTLVPASMFPAIKEYSETEEGQEIKNLLTDTKNLDILPSYFVTPDLCDRAVTENSAAILLVPDDLMTSEMCLRAVQDDLSLISIVPDHLYTLDICNLIAGTNWHMHIPDRYEKLFETPQIAGPSAP